MAISQSNSVSAINTLVSMENLKTLTHINEIAQFLTTRKLQGYSK